MELHLKTISAMDETANFSCAMSECYLSLSNGDVITSHPVSTPETAVELLTLISNIFSEQEVLCVLCNLDAESEKEYYSHYVESILKSNARGYTSRLLRNKAGKNVAGVLSVCADTLPESCDKPENSYGSIVHNQFLGELHVRAEPNLKNKNPHDQLFIMCAVVVPEYRQHRLGQFMVDHVHFLARMAGYKSTITECCNARCTTAFTKNRPNAYVRAVLPISEFHGSEERFGKNLTTQQRALLNEETSLVEEIVNGEGYNPEFEPKWMKLVTYHQPKL